MPIRAACSRGIIIVAVAKRDFTVRPYGDTRGITLATPIVVSVCRLLLFPFPVVPPLAVGGRFTVEQRDRKRPETSYFPRLCPPSPDSQKQRVDAATSILWFHSLSRGRN